MICVRSEKVKDYLKRKEKDLERSVLVLWQSWQIWGQADDLNKHSFPTDASDNYSKVLYSSSFLLPLLFLSHYFTRYYSYVSFILEEVRPMETWPESYSRKGETRDPRLLLLFVIVLSYAFESYCLYFYCTCYPDESMFFLSPTHMFADI